MLPTERRVRGRNVDLCVFEWGALESPGEIAALIDEELSTLVVPRGIE